MNGPMIEQPGVVVAVEASGAWIETRRESACGHCSSGDGCGVSLLGKVLKTRAQRLSVENSLGCEVGDRVIIATSPKELLQASFLLYLFPLLLMVVTAAVAQSAGVADSVVVVTSITALLTGFLMARLVAKGGSGPTLLRVVKPSSQVVAVNFPTGVVRDE